jgi:hypothetical protein
VEDKLEAGLQVENAHCYAKMIASVKELSFLRSLDTGDKLTPQELVRATAAKVGLAVPTVGFSIC